MKKIFDTEYLVRFKFPWWKRILFIFLKTHKTMDWGPTDKTVVMEFKRWRGITYVVGEFVIEPPKEEHE